MTDAHEHEGEEHRPRTGSWASIEMRVQRLESRVSSVETSLVGISRDVTSLSTDVKLVQSEQGHAKELMSTKFEAMENLVNNIGSKIDNLIDDVKSNYGDTRASLAEHVDFDKNIRDLQERVTSQQKLFDQLSGMGIVYRYVAGAGVAALLMSALALLHSLGVI